MDKKLIDQASKVVDILCLYHRHKVIGLRNIPKKGRCIVAVNHSFATYDILLLQNEIYKRLGRVPRALMDRWFFKFKFIADLMKSMGAEEGNHDSAQKLLREEQLICIAPGGMREAIRASDEKYKIVWDKRKGFAKLAIQTQTPIVLAACPMADEIFELYPNKLSLWFYQNFKLPFAILRGFGPSLIPRPVQLVHYISKPLVPPALELVDGDQIDPVVLDGFHKALVDCMKDLMNSTPDLRADPKLLTTPRRKTTRKKSRR